MYETFIFYGNQESYDLNGNLTYEGRWDKMTVHVEESVFFKDSVDTGKFVPGVFRVNPYTVSKCALSCTTGKYSFVVVEPYKTRLYWHDNERLGYFINIWDYEQPDLFRTFADRRSQVFQKAMANMGSSDLELGVEFGELRETLEMLRHPLKGLTQFLTKNGSQHVNSLNRLKRQAKSLSGFKKLSSRKLKEAADIWMEIRYGIRPLVYSVAGIAEHCNAVAKKIAREQIRSRGSHLDDIEAVSFSRQQHLTTVAAVNWQVNMDHVCTTRARIYYKQFYERTTMQNLGLSLEYVPEIIWDLTHLSFVVDWMFTVGPWLGSYRVKPGIRILGNTVSTKEVFTGTALPTPVSLHSDCTAEPLTSVSGHYEKSAYNREIDFHLPLFPQFRYADAVDMYRTLDSLALILQPVLKKLM